MNYRTQTNTLPNVDEHNERSRPLFMFVHLTKRTKFLVRVRLFNKRMNTNELPAARFTSCSPNVWFVYSPTHVSQPPNEVALFQIVLGDRRGRLQGIRHKPSSNTLSNVFGAYSQTQQQYSEEFVSCLFQTPSFLNRLEGESNPRTLMLKFLIMTKTTMIFSLHYIIS
ncbi:hypothetical protein Hdeb2414_s0002g00067221 [Helianthus debilis subsp. tardiflorus]